MEPKDDADCFGEQLCEAIEASDVRKLVGQHETQSLGRPFGGTVREKNGGPPQSERDRHVDRRAFTNAGGSASEIAGPGRRPAAARKLTQTDQRYRSATWRHR